MRHRSAMPLRHAILSFQKASRYARCETGVCAPKVHAAHIVVFRDA